MNWYKKSQQQYLWDKDPEIPYANQQWKSSGNIKDDIENCNSITELYRVFNAYNITDDHFEEISFPNADNVLSILINNEIYIIEPSFPSPSIKKGDEWIWDIYSDSLGLYVEETDFNKNFWEEVYPGQKVYHGTYEENLDNILKNGLESRDKTRGIDNRSTGPSIFTSENPDEPRSTYDKVIEIDIGAMKEDGYLIRASKEGPVYEAELRSTLADKIGLQNFYAEYEQGLDPSTIIFYGSIPPKYIRSLV